MYENRLCLDRIFDTGQAMASYSDPRVLMSLSRRVFEAWEQVWENTRPKDLGESEVSEDRRRAELVGKSFLTNNTIVQYVTVKVP